MSRFNKENAGESFGFSAYPEVAGTDSNMEDAGEGSSSNAYPGVTTTKSNKENAGEGSSFTIYSEVADTEVDKENIGEGSSSSAYPEVANTEDDKENIDEGASYDAFPGVSATESDMENADEDASSDASTDIANDEFEYDDGVSRHYSLTDSPKPDDGSDSEDSYPWENVLYKSDAEPAPDVNLASDPNLISLLLGETDQNKYVPPPFGQDHSYPFLPPVRTNKPFPLDWNDAQKAAAISPSSGYYEIRQPPREFPPDWTPAQIAAANSRTSPYYVAPGVPITSTTMRLPEVPLPGLFSHISMPPQPDQTSPPPEDQASEDTVVFAGLPIPSGLNPYNPGRSSSQSSTQNIPQFLNPALLTQNSSRFMDAASSSSSPTPSSNPPLSTILEPPTPTSQSMSPNSMIRIHSPPLSPKSSSPGVNLRPGQLMPVFDGILGERKNNENSETDNEPIWSSIQDRPAKLRPVSRIAKYGKVHLQQTADDPTRPVGGPTLANDVPCTLCFRKRDDYRASLEPQIRVELEAKIRKEMEPGLRQQIEGVVDQEYRERITNLQTTNMELMENIRKLQLANKQLTDKYDKLWCEKDQLKMDCERLNQEKADQEQDDMAGEMQLSIEIRNDIDETANELRAANTIDEKVVQLAKLMMIHERGAIPYFTQADVDAREQQLRQENSTNEESLKSKHKEEIAKLTADFQAEVSKVKSKTNGASMDGIQYQTKLAEQQRDFDRRLAENGQKYANALSENQQTYENALANKKQEFKQNCQNQLVEKENEHELHIQELAQQLSLYSVGQDHDDCARQLREMENQHRRDLFHKHAEYSEALAKRTSELNDDMTKKDQEIGNLRAEIGSLRADIQERALQHVFHTQRVLSFEEI